MSSFTKVILIDIIVFGFLWIFCMNINEVKIKYGQI